MTRRARLVRSAAIAAILATTITGVLAAQSVRGTVTDSASRQPISGAVITLFDSAGTTLGRSIANERGEYRVASAGVAHSLRIVRIGFLPRQFQLADPAGVDRTIDIVLVTFKTTLAPVVVRDKSICPRRGDRETAFAFWDQARAGLLSTVVAREASSMQVDRLTFQRALNGEHESIGRFVVGRDIARSATSFEAARTARDFVRDGFKGDSEVVGLIFGPDADVLLDDAFAHGYCFRLAEPKNSRPSQVGLVFSPADFRRGRVDIEGTLWIDTSARALRDVEYQYLGLDPLSDKFHPGGMISFATGSNGVAFIDRWYLRLFSKAIDDEEAIDCGKQCRRFYYATENGAEVAHVLWPDGQHWDAKLGTVSIRAQTISRKAAVGSVVQLNNTPYLGTADSSGTIVIRDLLPGPYTLKIRDARIAQLGFLLPTPITFEAFRDSVIQLAVEVPTAGEYVTSLCQQHHQWTAGDSTAVFGRVVDLDDRPIADARISFALLLANRSWGVAKETFKTGTDGLFESCSAALLPGRTIRVRVMRAGKPNIDVVRMLTGNLTILPIRVDDRR